MFQAMLWERMSEEEGGAQTETGEAKVCSLNLLLFVTKVFVGRDKSFVRLWQKMWFYDKTLFGFYENHFVNFAKIFVFTFIL